MTRVSSFFKELSEDNEYIILIEEIERFVVGFGVNDENVEFIANLTIMLFNISSLPQIKTHANHYQAIVDKVLTNPI